MKLKILGSSSGRENSHSGQANCSEKISSLAFSPSIWTTAFPSASFVAISSASNTLLLESSFKTIRSITTSIESFLFFSNSMFSLKSNISPLTRTLTKPSLRSFSNSSLWLPFSPWTTGDMITILVPSGYSKTLLVISSTLWEVIGMWWFGQYGTPTRANNSLK